MSIFSSRDNIIAGSDVDKFLTLNFLMLLITYFITKALKPLMKRNLEKSIIVSVYEYCGYLYMKISSVLVGFYNVAPVEKVIVIHHSTREVGLKSKNDGLLKIVNG